MFSHVFMFDLGQEVYHKASGMVGVIESCAAKLDANWYDITGFAAWVIESDLEPTNES